MQHPEFPCLSPTQILLGWQACAFGFTLSGKETETHGVRERLWATTRARAKPVHLQARILTSWKSPVSSPTSLGEPSPHPVLSPPSFLGSRPGLWSLSWC